MYEIDPVRDPRWAELVDRHPRSSVFHTSNWIRALHDVYGYEPVVVTTCAPDARLTNGMVFCQINSWLTGRRLVSLPFSDHCEPLISSFREFDEILLYVRRKLGEEKQKYLEIRPVALWPKGRAELAMASCYILHRLDLRPSLPELFHRCHKDCVQRKIRRAERERLQYEEGNSENSLQKFYRLLVMTRRRQSLPPQPLKWFRELIRNFGKDVKIRVASKDGQAVASILTLSHKKSMMYKYGCSDAAFNKFGGTALLFWKTIQDAKDCGLEEFDLGRSDLNNEGLIAFKKRWGASRTEINYWSYPPEPSGLPTAWKNRLARHVVPRVPDLGLEVLGRLLYRHIG